MQHTRFAIIDDDPVQLMVAESLVEGVLFNEHNSEDENFEDSSNHAAFVGVLEVFESPYAALVAHIREPFNILLCDTIMPGMSGGELASLIRGVEKENLLPEAYIVGLTALSKNEDKKKGLNAGMDAMLRKPLEISALQAVLQCRPHSTASG